MFDEEKETTKIIAGMNDAKSRTGKGKPVCVLHTEWVTG
jgi:hypothetical protein